MTQAIATLATVDAPAHPSAGVPAWRSPSLRSLAANCGPNAGQGPQRTSWRVQPLKGGSTFGTYVDELVSYTVAKPRHAPIRYYTHANHLYSVAATTNTRGAVVERYSYNAYGVRTVKNLAGATLTKSAVGQDRGFTGYKLDAETGLYFARARMYSSKLGRFISRDFAEIDNRNFIEQFKIAHKADDLEFDREIEFIKEKFTSIQMKAKSPERLMSFVANLLANQRARMVQSQTRSFMKPYAGDGYWDGVNLYSGYMVPGKNDSTGHAVTCYGVGGFAGYYLALSGSVFYCCDDSCPQNCGLVICFGVGGGIGASVGVGDSVGQGSYGSGNSVQQNVQGSYGPGGVGTTANTGSGGGVGASLGVGAGAAITYEGCHAF